MAVNVKDMLDTAMIDLSLRFPTHTDLLVRIGTKLVKSPDVDAIAWTDNKNIYLNENAIIDWCENPIRTGDDGKQYDYSLNSKNIEFLLCHELFHLLNRTVDRGEAKGIKTIQEHQLWNCATDYEINSLLKNNRNDNVMNPVGEMPGVGLYDPKYIDMTAEEIYDELLKENNQRQDSNGDGDGDSDDTNGNGKSQSNSNAMKSNDEDTQGDSTGGNGPAKNLPGIDKHLPCKDEDAKNEILSKIAEVLASKSQGSGLDSSIERMLNIVYKPQKFNWRKALSKYIKNYIKANYTWNKPSRAGIANGLILPSSSTTPRLKIGIAIDTSGSVGDEEITAMMNHLYTILQQFKSFEINVWACSTIVHENTILKLTEHNKQDITKFVPESTGGTYMSANLEFIEKKMIGNNKPDLLIIMSDFYDNLDGDTTTIFNICPIVYLCVGRKDFKKPTKIKGEAYPFEI